MRKHLRPRLPSPSMVVAMIALFVTLGPVAYAANTVGSSDIIDEAILSQDIKNGEVRGPDVGANAIGSGKVIDNSLKAGDIDESTLGKVPNAGKLDGIDSAGFLQGRVVSNRVTTTGEALVLSVPGYGEARGVCQTGTDGGVEIRFKNTTATVVDTFYDARSHGMGSGELGSGVYVQVGREVGPGNNHERATIQVGRMFGADRRIATVIVMAEELEAVDECTFQAQAVTYAN